MNPEGGGHASSVQNMAIKNHGSPKEIAGMAVYLAEPGAATVTGADLRIDGGFAA